MTKIKLTFLFAVCCLTAVAQTTKPLPTNELGQLTYSEIVPVENASKELLFTNALNYLESLVDNHKNLKKGPYVSEDSTELYLPLAYTVYKDFPVHSPHGKIKYQFKVSVKEGRYRYVADSFVFYYLERNRYGKFVEVKGKSKSLEEPFYKGNQKLWEKHKQGTREKVELLVETLRAEMMIPPDGPKEEIVKVEDDW